MYSLRSAWRSPYFLLLAPAFIIILYHVGRGLGHTVFVLYWLIACGSILKRREFGFPARETTLFLILLAWGSLAGALSIDPSHALAKWWAQFALWGTTFFISWQLIRRIPDFNLEHAIRVIGVAGLLAFAYYGVNFLYHASRPDFHPETQVHGLGPAYLAPFALYTLRQKMPGLRGTLVAGTYAITLLLFLVFSNSRTEVIAFAAALTVMLTLSIRDKRQLLILLAILLLGLIMLVLRFNKTGSILAHSSSGNWLDLMDKLSSYRTYIWRKAVAIPPPNVWVGIGPGLVGRYPPVVIEGKGTVGHLHNLFLDAWYEMGFVGVALYISYYVALTRRACACANKLTSPELAVLWASLAAIAAACMLEQSYRSYHVSMFVPFLLALYAYCNMSGTRQRAMP